MRLKHYNSGAVLTLRPDDLLLAAYLPPSTGVRVAKIIITPGGDSEFADYQTATASNEPFRHEELVLGENELNGLRTALHSLGEATCALRLTDLAFDPFEYETPFRMNLRFWHERKVVECNWVSRRLYRDFSIANDLEMTFIESWRHVSDQLFALLPWNDEVPRWVA